MPEIKEKPKTGRAKSRHSGYRPAQTGRPVDEGKIYTGIGAAPEPEEGSSTYAVDQVEQAGRWAAGEVSRASTPSRRREADVETRGEADGRYSTPSGPQEGDPSARARRPQGSSPHAGGDPKGADRPARYQAPNDPSAPAVPFKDRAHTVPEAVPIRERPRMAVKERERSCFRQAEGQIASSQTSKQPVQPGAISGRVKPPARRRLFLPPLREGHPPHRPPGVPPRGHPSAANRLWTWIYLPGRTGKPVLAGIPFPAPRQEQPASKSGLPFPQAAKRPLGQSSREVRR